MDPTILAQAALRRPLQQINILANPLGCLVVIDPDLAPALEAAALFLPMNKDPIPPPPPATTASSPTTPPPPLTFQQRLVKEGCSKVVTLTEEHLDWTLDGPIVFMLRPRIPATKIMAATMRALTRQRTTKPEFRVWYFPRRSFECEEELREDGVWPLIKTHPPLAMPLGFVPLADDVISLELDHCLREIKLEGDQSSLMWTARALLDLQSICGSKFRKIRSKGSSPKDVLDMYLRMLKERHTRSVWSQDGGGPHHHHTDEGDFDEGNSAMSAGSALGAGAGAAAATTYEHGWAPVVSTPTIPEEDWIDARRDPYAAASVVGGPLDVLGAAESPHLPQASSSSSSRPPLLDTLVMIDRNVDLVTPLCTSLTYSSMLEELDASHKLVFDNGLMVTPPREIDEQEPTTPQCLIADDVFKDIRDADVVMGLMPMLNDKAKQLKETRDEVHRTREVSELQAIVKRIPQMQFLKERLSLHIALAQRIQTVTADLDFQKRWHIERGAIEGDGKELLILAQECASRGERLLRVLRLLCLYSITTGGLSSSKLDEIRRDLVHAYGFDTMFVLDDFEKMGMLAIKGPQHRLVVAGISTIREAQGGPAFYDWAGVRKAFVLSGDVDARGGGGDGAAPTTTTTLDESYPYGGFTPLSVRLVQLAITPGWDQRMDMLQMLDGPSIWDVVPTSGSNNNNDHTPPTPPPPSMMPSTSTTKKPIMIVFYLGGVTWGEIAALRFISQQPDSPFRIVVATTKVMNGNRLLSSLAGMTITKSTSMLTSSSRNPFGNNSDGERNE